MSTPAHHPATYDDLLAAPPAYKTELIGGALVSQEQPTARHQVAASALISAVGAPFQRGDGGPGGWWTLYKLEVHFGAEVLVPDLAGWRRERMPLPPKDDIFDIRPDWVCEILSPSTAHHDRNQKAEIYARAGVDYFWLLDPDAPLLEAFENQNGKWLRHAAFGPDDAVTAPPFGDVPFVLKSLWE